ncbi:MAG: fluoride efflux transporter CrcB [Alphaproteobacteria bacterium]|nr:fluoride efflux transporter CrcB [Alphaproteobacteria bacterium]TAD90305.1 MAG: fluoride efflux transporter CrcB [Alphaproteobacteria bacterium]
MSAWLAVALGGAIGSLGRYLAVGWVTGLVGPGFPYGTLAVNVIGGFAMGAVVALAEATAWINPTTRLLLATGILGGFTTFSAFSLDVMQQLDRGAVWSALAYALVSVLGSVAALWCGRALARMIG